MLRQFLVGGGASLVAIAIHALIMTMVVQVARCMGAKQQSRSSLVLIAVMIPTISVLMAAHVIEVFVWALAYLIFDVAPAGANLVYFAFVNYATLGYGDVLPVEGWRLLSPLTAMNGMLLFWMVDRSQFRGPTANLGAHPRYQWLTEVSSLTPGNIGALCRGL